MPLEAELPRGLHPRYCTVRRSLGETCIHLSAARKDGFPPASSKGTAYAGWTCSFVTECAQAYVVLVTGDTACELRYSWALATRGNQMPTMVQVYCFRSNSTSYDTNACVTSRLPSLSCQCKASTGLTQTATCALRMLRIEPDRISSQCIPSRSCSCVVCPCSAKHKPISAGVPLDPRLCASLYARQSRHMTALPGLVETCLTETQRTNIAWPGNATAARR